MKKLSLILAISLILLSFVACGKDTDNTSSVISLPPIEDYEVDEFVSIGKYNGFHYVEYFDHIELTEYDDAEFAVELKFPAVILDKPVTKISIPSFRDNAFLKSAVIPDTVQEIGNYLFAYCTSLTDITLPENIKKIGCSAFLETPWFEALTDKFVVVGDGVLIKYNGDDSEVVIPDTVKYLSDALSETSKIISIDIPLSVTGISDYAFYNCSSLGDINIPSHISDIGTHILDKTTWLMAEDGDFITVGNSVLIHYSASDNEVVIPDGIKYIAGGFSSNETVTKVTIPDSVIRVRSASFYECKNLKSVEFKGYITHIDAAAFANCTNLSDVTLPAGLKVLESRMFYSCSKLTDIKLPSSIKLIGKAAFYSCNELINIEFPETLKALDSAAFFGCTKLQSLALPDSVENFGDVTFACCYELAEFKLPPKITDIPLGLFSFCVKLTELRFGEQVTNIGDSAFEACKDLKVYIAGESTELGKDVFVSCEDGTYKIYCKNGSVAEKYAKENKIKYAEYKD